MKTSRWIAAIALLVFSTVANADARFAGVFGDHMVLQAQTNVPIWGYADPGENITVSMADQKQTTVAGKDGRWQIKLAAMKPNSIGQSLTVSAKKTLVIDDVLIGEVWLASGQSNMQYSLKTDQDAATELPKANYPDFRFCMVGTRAEREPMADRKLSWEAVTPESAKKLSAVAYYFARDLHKSLKEPVGIIESSVPGTVAEAWTNIEAFHSTPVLEHLLDQSAVPTTATSQPAFGAGSAAALYNGMIAPLIPYAIKGAIWYQGESNAGNYEEYRTLFPAMISGWRAKWGQGDFPFLFVQLPGFGKRGEPDRQNWAPMREAQTAALKLPNVGMAVALDLVPARALLHPKSKVGVGHRLSLVAEHQVYGEAVEDSGPTFIGMNVDGQTVRLRFDHAGGGLVVGSPRENATQPTAATEPIALKGFALAGDDHRFYPADASVEGADGSVAIRSDHVSVPIAVRYGWADNPDANLYNRAGLPAPPFRSDDWPIPVPGKAK